MVGIKIAFVSAATCEARATSELHVADDPSTLASECILTSSATPATLTLKDGSSTAILDS